MAFGLQGKVYQDALRFSAEREFNLHPPTAPDISQKESPCESIFSLTTLSYEEHPHILHPPVQLQLDPRSLGSPLRQQILGLYRQARFKSFTCASLFVIMVANTRPKRTLLINT